MGKDDLLEEDDEELRGFSQMDIDGSAKVAAIGVSGMITALNNLYVEFSEYQAEISDLLIIAGKILNEMENEFPGFRNFKRPGFDE